VAAGLVAQRDQTSQVDGDFVGLAMVRVLYLSREAMDSTDKESGKPQLKDAAHSQEWAGYLALVNRDAHAGGDQGWGEDWSPSFLPWGFEPASVQAAVALWQGLQDTARPLSSRV